MTIILDWPALAILAAAFVAAAWINSRCSREGGLDTVPGNGIGQAPDQELVEGKVGFRS